MLLTVKVYPRSKKNRVEWEQGQLKVHLTAPPVEGAANEALVALLSEQLDLPKRAITIVRGMSSRQKTVEIIGLTLEEVRAKKSIRVLTSRATTRVAPTFHCLSIRMY